MKIINIITLLLVLGVSSSEASTSLSPYRPKRRLLWDYCESANLRRPIFGIAIKNNLIYDAFTIPNLGFEFGTAPQWTIDLSFSYDVFDRKNESRMKHFIGRAELRYWPCQQFDGHFWGAYTQSGVYNIGGEMPYGIKISDLTKYRYEGTFYGGGLSYGYHIPLDIRWAIEMTLSVGYARINYDRYRCTTCGDKLDSGAKNYFGPTRIGISWMYMIH